MSRNDVDSQVRTSAYDVLNTFVIHSASQSLSVVATLSDVILQRLENTLAMRNQIVSVEDRVTLENIQLGLSDVLMVGRPQSCS